jgi:hypothetical protein
MTLTRPLGLDDHRWWQEIHLVADLTSHLNKARVGRKVDAASV